MALSTKVFAQFGSLAAIICQYIIKVLTKCSGISDHEFYGADFAIRKET